MMKKIYFLLPVLACIVIIASCKKDYIYGDITPNTDRVIVEFTDAKEAHNIAIDYVPGTATVDVADLEFMVRSVVKTDALVKIKANPDIVNDYNTENGTSYTSIPFNLFSFGTTDITLTPTERKKTVSVSLKPSDISTGEWAIGLQIESTSVGEVSQLANKIVVILSVKNKYDGNYHLKGFYTRNDAAGADYNGPFETDVQLITTGLNSVAMYSEELGGYAQPFYDYGGDQLGGFSNVGPEISFNATDQVSGIVNYTGAPVMTLYPGVTNRYVSGTPPTLYLKYYYNADPSNRIFADTLTYTGPR